jgi:hypothetical protein
MRPPPFVIRQVAQHLERTQQRAHAHAEQQQAKLLARIVARYRDTDLGRELGLPSVHDVASFRSVVRTQLPADYVPRWDAAKEHNRPGMVHPKRLEFMGLSSGTSGVDKFIPFPDEQFANFRLFTNHAFFHAFFALDDATLLAENILVTSGPPIREVTPSGITIGYGSGLATLKAPRFARQLVRPTRAVLEIPAWGDKIRAMVDEAIDLDIRVLTGVPNSVVPLLEQLLGTARERGHNVRCAKDVWPNLRVYAYSGSTLTMWEARLRELLGRGRGLLRGVLVHRSARGLPAPCWRARAAAGPAHRLPRVRARGWAGGRARRRVRPRGGRASTTSWSPGRAASSPTSWATAWRCSRGTRMSSASPGATARRSTSVSSAWL